MYYDKELDQPLNFNADTKPEPITRNSFRPVADTVVMEALTTPQCDCVAAYAQAEKKKRDAFGSEFGDDGGYAASKYASSVRKAMHHEQEYRPCRILTAEEYAKKKSP
jgi:hypothetical protein